MSGFVAIVNLDGAPLDRRLLDRMTDYLAFRGPDDRRVHVTRDSGLGYTLLRVTDESAHERQPFTLDGRTWIVADARVNSRLAYGLVRPARASPMDRGEPRSVSSRLGSAQGRSSASHGPVVQPGISASTSFARRASDSCQPR